MENTEVASKEPEKSVTKPVENSAIINKEVVTSCKSKESVCVGGGEGTAQPTPLQSQQPVSRPRSSREEKMRKKDDKSVDHVLKALNSLNTSEEKLAAMCKKYADIFDENRKIQLALKQAEKRCCTLQREKEQLQTDHSKAILTRSRLENLCRELQRQNKAIKDESLLKIREEEEKRKEVSAKFQTTLNEITALMQQNNDKNLKLRDDNIDMNAKLKNVCEQYELREQQVEKISKQMQLEAQLADAKLAKAKMEMAAEREIMLREKQQLLLELSQYQSRCQEFQATEINLRSQISMYDDKYDEFQKALARSNEVFGGFKGEMEKMSKKMCKLEKEVSTWKQRWEGSHKALLEMAEEKQKSDQELSHSSKQLQALQRLCRTLQSERSSLLAKLKEVPDAKSDSTSSVSSTADGTLKQDQPGNCDLLQTDNKLVKSKDITVAESACKQNSEQDINVREVDLTITEAQVSSIEPPQVVDVQNSKCDNVKLNGCTTQPTCLNEKDSVDESTVGSRSTSVIVNNITVSSSAHSDCTSESSGPPASSVEPVTVDPKLVSDPVCNHVNNLQDRTASANTAGSVDDALPADNKIATQVEQCTKVLVTVDENSSKVSTAVAPPTHHGDVVVLEHNGVEEQQPADSSSPESKLKTNRVDNVAERPAKKHNNDAKKGKESKKKKKNA